MGKFQRLFITAAILLGCANAYSAVVEKTADHRLIVNNDGKVIYQDVNRINGREVYVNNWQKSQDAEARYIAKKINQVRVQHASSGMLSSSTVPVTRTATVPKKTVFKNLLTKAVIGGRLVTGAASGPIGWAITATTVYELIAPTLKENGYVWDSYAQNFVTDKDYIIEIRGNGGPKDSDGKYAVLYRIGLTKRSYDYGYESYKPTLDALCDKASKDVDDYSKNVFNDDTHRAKQYLGSDFRGSCNSITVWGSATKAMWSIKPNNKEPITQSEFDRIIEPLSDASPSTYVNASAKDDGTIEGVSVDDNVTVPNGTVVTIGPYTDSDGQPKQITVTFNTQNGQTSVNVQTTPRPDLTPNSPAAPSAGSQSGSQTGSQTGNQPGSQSDTESDGKTDGGKEVHRDKDTDSKTDEKQDDKTDETPKEGSFLCNIFPDILACAKMGDIQEDEPFNIPHVIDDTTFKPDFFLPDTGQCPAPEVVSIMGQSYEFSYMWLCKFAEMIRFLVIGIAGIAAAYIMFSSLRKG